MRKSFRMFLALALVVLGAVSVKAQERISLQEVPFYRYEGWGAEAQKMEAITPAWVMGVEDETPYGDASVNKGADLSAYSKLYVTVDPSAEAPRIMMNRMIENGQCADTQEESNLISIPSHGWCTTKYSTKEGDTYIVDLKAIFKDYGFVRLHAIKGARYGVNAIVLNAEVELAANAQPVGWTEVTTNADLEDDDASSFFTKIAPSADTVYAEITDGVGVDGSRGLWIAAPAKVTNDYETQFWVVSSEVLPAGTKYRLSFDCMADSTVSVATQAHARPGEYIHYQMAGNVNFTADVWEHFSYEGEVTAQQAANADGKLLQSIALNLSMDTDVEYYFDNIRLEVYKYGVSAEFAYDVVKLDFGFNTNLPALVEAGGKPRLLYPAECATVKVNGEAVEVESVEGFADGRFYIFLMDALNDDDKVEVTFTNPADAAYHLTYDGGPGGDVKDFAGDATYNYDAAAAEDAYAYTYVTPTLMAADPEHGSFNLPNSISEFKATFDKVVDCAKVEATLNGEKLTVEPAEGFAEALTFKRTSTGDLPSGEYKLNITNIYPEIPLDESIFGDTTYVLNIGKVNLDPSDTIRVILPDYFSQTSAGGVPEGYTLYFGEEVRVSGTGYSSGSRMFDFGAGGDFTKGLYFREGRLEYGYNAGYELTLEAGKSYNIHFNTAMWKSNGEYMKFEILNDAEEIVMEQLIKNTPDVNGSTNAIFNTTSVDLKFQPAATGNYYLKWWSSNANGETTGAIYAEVLLANVSIKYVPNAVGVEETQLLLTALANAKATRDGNGDEKYAGAAYSALVEAITKYEAEYETYTAPSAYKNGAAALDAAATAMKDHRALCDAYYALPGQVKDIVDKNADKKFARTELYAQLKELTPKYVFETEVTEQVTDPVTGETKDTVYVKIEYKKIVEDAELQAAIDELQVPVNTASKLFTEGESKATTTGIAALIERLRLGAEALKSLGVAQDDPLVVAANNALDDDDELAKMIQNRLKLELYNHMKDPKDSLFAEKVDTATLTTYTDKYDMTVFVKNPNMYATGITYVNNNLSKTWETPGWAAPEGANAPGISTGWSNATYEVLDCMFQTWVASYAIEQTVVDLPVGVYTVVGSFGERDSSTPTEGSFFYVKTSDTPEGEYADTIEAPSIGQTFPVDNIAIENIVVADGQLTIGAVGNPSSHTFFNQVKIYIAGLVDGYDYSAAYGEIAEGVDVEQAAPAQVVRVELYDLNGRRVNKATNGIYIVRKYMNNGTIQVGKIIK